MCDERTAGFLPSGHLGRRALFALTALALAALVAEPADAQRLRRASVVLEGYVGEAPAGVRVEAQLTLQSGGRSTAFAVTRALAQTGGRPQRQVLHDARPHQNTLVLRGNEAALAPLWSASAGQQLRISGEHRTGTNTVQVSRIDAVSADPAPTAAAP